MNFPPFIYKIPHPFLLFLDIKKDPKAFLVLSVIRVCRLRPLLVSGGSLCPCSGCVLSVSAAASQKKGAVSYCFDPILCCRP